MKRWISALLGVLLLGGSLLGNFSVAAAETAPKASAPLVETSRIPGTLVDPAIRYQTMEGWGTSLCWWANSIGGWTEDYNGNGIPDREEIAELVFSPEYLNLNIVRYNIGGGENPDDEHIQRVEAKMPGWKRYEGDELHPEYDENQLWMLRKANEYQPKNIINKVFANSPPWYMTHSGSPTGNYNSWDDNLRPEKLGDFTEYLAEVSAWIDQDLTQRYGTGVEYVSPMNEPDTGYWGYGSTKQEGNHVSPGESQSNLLLATREAFDNYNLSHVKVTGTDETSIASAKDNFLQLSPEAKTIMNPISAHTYNPSGKKELRDTAFSYDRELWMSEICFGDGGHDCLSLESALWLGHSIREDLMVLQPSAWVAWLAADSEYEGILHDENWGLLHAVFEDEPVAGYHNQAVFDEYESGRRSKGYWAVTKQFYALMQYSKYIKAGYTIIEIDDGNMVAALSPDRTELVVVAVNRGDSYYSDDLLLHKFPLAEYAKVIRTSSTENAESVGTLPVQSGRLSVVLDEQSITTYVIRNEQGRPLMEEDGYATPVNNAVALPHDAEVSGVSTLNKFHYYQGHWSTSYHGSAYSGDYAYTDDIGAGVSFSFDGTGIRFTGRTSDTPAVIEVSVNGSPPEEITLVSTREEPDSILYESDFLGEGSHEISITLKEGVLEIDAAQIVQGELQHTPEIRYASGYDTAVALGLEHTVEGESYTLYYGTKSSELSESFPFSGEENSLVVRELTNDTTYYFSLAPEGAPIVAATPRAVSEQAPLYYVNAGGYPYQQDERATWGRYSSNLEQRYGVDIVTGKKWGYDDGNGKSTARTGVDSLHSVRVDEQDTERKGLTYYFELAPGEYSLSLGMKDPWNNHGRKQDIYVQYQPVEVEITAGSGFEKSYPVTVGNDGILTVEILRSQGVTDPDMDPLISYLMVQQAEDNPVVEVTSPETAAIVPGHSSQLPTTVDVILLDGTVETRKVRWNLPSENSLIPYQQLTVTGSVAGTPQLATIEATIFPQQLLYFIDSNFASSPRFALAKEQFSLENETADNIYTEQSWGYINHGVQPYNGSTIDSTGLWAEEGNDIVYRIPLAKGRYQATTGFYEWWTGPRHMTITASSPSLAPSDTAVLGRTTVSSGQRKGQVSGEFTLSQADEVEIRIAKTSGPSQQAPILSWIGIASLDAPTPSAERSVKLADIDNVNGAAGTEITIPLSVKGIVEDTYRSLEGKIKLPEGLEFVGLDDAGTLRGGSLSVGAIEDGTLRFAYVNSQDSTTLSTNNPNSYETLANLRLRTKRSHSQGDSFTVAIDSFTGKTCTEESGDFNTYRGEEFDVSLAKSKISIGTSGTDPEDITAHATKLYIGDGVDLIPANKKAVSVVFTNLPDGDGVRYGDAVFYYNEQRSQRTGQTVYVGIVDSDVSLEALSLANNYTFASGQQQSVTFGKTNDQAQIDAQDALNILDAWLRKKPVEGDKEILSMNVTADRRIDTSDVLAIVDYFVNSREFEVVQK